MEKSKNLIWKFKWIFIKWLFIVLSILLVIVGGIVGGIYSVILLLDKNEDIITGLLIFFLKGIWFLISTWYITVPLSILLFIYRNKKWVDSLSNKKIKELDEVEIFGMELWLFIKSIFQLNYFSMWVLMDSIGDGEIRGMLMLIMVILSTFISLMVLFAPKSENGLE
jgi:hypothetical protein